MHTKARVANTPIEKSNLPHSFERKVHDENGSIGKIGTEVEELQNQTSASYFFRFLDTIQKL